MRANESRASGPFRDLKMTGVITQEVNKDRKREGKEQVKGELGDGVRANAN
jgi:hypothetical protein